MSDNQDSATAKAITDIQEKMLEFHKELQDLKKGGAMSVAISPLLPGNSQLLVAPDDSGNSDNRSGGVQRKGGRETEEDQDSDDDPTKIDADTFQLSEAGEAFLETAFKKRMDSLDKRSALKSKGCQTAVGRSALPWILSFQLTSLRTP